jgi:phosphate transport system substrate-binding protein
LGVGIAALLNATADIANCSRKLESEEIGNAESQGKDPKKFMVGFDSLAVYVHKNNPVSVIGYMPLPKR